MATDAPKGSSDFLRFYVIVLGLFAAVLGYFLWRLNGERREYETANAQARAIFGGPDAAATPADQRPTTVRGLAIGVQKYLATYKAATVKTSDNGPPIPMTLIADRAGGMGLVVQNRNDQPPSRNQAKRYEELSTMITFEPTDLERLAKFLYNLEASSTQIRVLDVRWELRPEKENPPVPGYLITRPQVKIGFRRPIAGRT
jgi:hypothetical protein